MTPKKLSGWLKCIFVIIGICGVIGYAMIPMFGADMREIFPEFSNRFFPWLVFLWISGVPCFVVLVLAWRIATNIGRDQSFSRQNAGLLKWISALAVGDAGFFLIGNVLLLLFDMSHPGVVLASFVVVFVGIAVAVVSAVLSHLVNKAAALQEQSDLTI